MSPFNFQTKTVSIKTLELSQEDSPSISIEGNQLVISAKRGTEQISIVTPLPEKSRKSIENVDLKPYQIQPQPVVTTVKTVQTRGKHPLKGVVLPSSDKRSGENNHLSKLTAVKVREIRELANDPDIIKAYGSRTNFCVEIGKAYNVHFTTVMNILNRVSWKHI